MATQTITGHSFPTPCKRCGGALYRQVDYCPYCGAVHPLEGGPHKRAVIPGSRASAMNKVAQKIGFDPAAPGEPDLASRTANAGESLPGEAVMHTPSIVATHPPAPALTDLPESKHRAAIPNRRTTLLIVGVLVVIGLVAGAYALFGDSRDSQNGGNDQSADATQDARTTTGTIALYKPQEAQRAQQSAANTPAAPGANVRANPIFPTAPVVQPLAAAPVKPAPQFRDAAQAVQAARLAFRANDLSTAQAALGAAQTLQPGNADAQDLAIELRPLTARRDAALQAAQTCVAQQSWPCARQHANEALTIDTGNDTAKIILERVIRETGWAPLNSHAATAAQ
ncbi:hypothetical protein [Paraburkholderia sp. BL21I4N1]|uniref:hypothetical protein n=1 Tax=Paraburkholderia sp. BL21I4N1 TaxID=1938801 RepID=UPI000CFB5F7C|nr:hypothetical protein [Paraburkholderia sp. BL21I4N1]PQV48015.1 hypothetical protein B0G83_109101 [Paraburkholderia sp. BL21I4N1]